MLGRMLTRTTSSPATTVKFEWDGWDCIREYTAPSGNATYDSPHLDTDVCGSAGVTLYYVVNGFTMAKPTRQQRRWRCLKEAQSQTLGMSAWGCWEQHQERSWNPADVPI